MTVKFGDVTLETRIEGDVLSLTAGERRRLFKVLDTIKNASRAEVEQPKRRRRRKQGDPEPVAAALPPETPVPEAVDPLDSSEADVPF